MSLPLFQNSALLTQAMTHRSYVHEYPNVTQDNERLEFLGDAVLTYMVGAWLYQAYPAKTEGELTPLRSALVDAEQLANFARIVGIPAHLRLGRSAEKGGGRDNPNLLSSAFEALIGAYLVDTGFDLKTVQHYVEPLWLAQIDRVAIAVSQRNVKSRFQEWALATWGENPQYTIIESSGPAHARQFTAIVTVQGRPFGQGTGRRKQDAEKQAATAALQSLPEGDPLDPA